MNNSTRFNAAEAEYLIFELSESKDFDEVLCSKSESSSILYYFRPLFCGAFATRTYVIPVNVYDPTSRITSNYIVLLSNAFV